MKTRNTRWEYLAGALGLKRNVSGNAPAPSGALEFYHSTFDNLIEGCQVMDFGWRYLYLNKAAEIHSRKPNDQLLGKTFTGEYPGIETTEVYAKIKQCLEERIPSRMVNRFVYPDQKVGWFLLSIHPVPEGAMIFSYDITDRIETERQLEQMKRLYSTLGQVNQTIVRVKERDELYRAVCEVAVKFGHFSLAWIGLLDEPTGDIIPVAATGLDIGKWPFDKINIHEGTLKDTITASAIRLSRVVSNEDVQGMGIDPVFEQQLKNYPFRSIAAVPISQGSSVIGTLTIVSPESGFFRSREEIDLLEEMGLDLSFALDNIETNRIKQQWASAFEHSGHGIAFGDSRLDRFSTCNPAFAKMHGGTIEEVCSHPISSYYLPEDLYLMREMIRKADLDGSVQFEVRKKKLDGSLFYAQANLVNVYDKEGNILYKVASQLDISAKKKAEELVLTSERNLKLFVKYAPAAIAMFDREMRYIAVSERFLSDYKISGEDPVGRSHYELFPELTDEIKQIHQHCLAGATEKANETRFVRTDGTVDWVRWEMHPWLESEETIGGVILFSEVITDRKLAEKKIRESEEKFRKAFMTSPDSITISRLSDGLFLLVNRGFTEMTGYAESEAIGKTASEMRIWANPEDRKGLVDGLKKDGVVYGLETAFRLKDGTLRDGLLSASVIDLDGVPYILTSIHDITDTKTAQQEVRRISRHFQSLILKAPDGFVLITGEGKFSFISPAARKMLGYTPEDVVPDDPASLTHPDDMPEVVSQLQRIFGDPAYSPTLQYRFRHRDGSWRWIESTFSNLLDDPDVHAVVINFRDVTERRKTQEDLRISEAEVRTLNLELEERVARRTAELQAANRELEAFSYSVSHDLRAPLRGISGFIQILLEDYAESLDQEGKRLCAVIQDNSVKMARLIDDLLAFSRLNRAGMSFETVDMKSLANEVFLEAHAVSPGKEVDFQLEDLPEIKGDRNMLRQVWVNLVSNAFKYSATREKPVITISCRVEKGLAVYCINDNGVGFDMKYRDKLFTVFQRLHSPKEFDGTGVGLAIVQRIIHRHGGIVWAEGEVDRGASFYFSLPLMQNPG